MTQQAGGWRWAAAGLALGQPTEEQAQTCKAGVSDECTHTHVFQAVRTHVRVEALEPLAQIATVAVLSSVTACAGQGLQLGVGLEQAAKSIQGGGRARDGPCAGRLPSGRHLGDSGKVRQHLRVLCAWGEGDVEVA